MTKREFNDIKVGDIMVYSKKGVLTDCEFKVTKLQPAGNRDNDFGVVVKAGGDNMSEYYQVGKALHFNEADFTRGLIKFKNGQVADEEFQISLSREELAALSFYVGKMMSPPHGFRTLYDKLCKAAPKDLQEYYGWTSFKNPVDIQKSEEEIRNLQEYLWPAPKPKRGVLRMPNGKFAPKNYRRVMYPAGGTGGLVLRHILMGDFVEGKSATNVHVEE